MQHRSLWCFPLRTLGVRLAAVRWQWPPHRRGLTERKLNASCINKQERHRKSSYRRKSGPYREFVGLEKAALNCGNVGFIEACGSSHSYFYSRTFGAANGPYVALDVGYRPAHPFSVRRRFLAARCIKKAYSAVATVSQGWVCTFAASLIGGTQQYAGSRRCICCPFAKTDWAGAAKILLVRVDRSYSDVDTHPDFRRSQWLEVAVVLRCLARSTAKSRLANRGDYRGADSARADRREQARLRRPSRCGRNYGIPSAAARVIRGETPVEPPRYRHQRQIHHRSLINRSS